MAYFINPKPEMSEMFCLFWQSWVFFFCRVGKSKTCLSEMFCVHVFSCHKHSFFLFPKVKKSQTTLSEMFCVFLVFKTNFFFSPELENPKPLCQSCSVYFWFSHKFFYFPQSQKIPNHFVSHVLCIFGCPTNSFILPRVRKSQTTLSEKCVPAGP